MKATKYLASTAVLLSLAGTASPVLAATSTTPSDSSSEASASTVASVDTGALTKKTKQTMEIRKIIADTKKPVAGAHFTVYDITDLLNKVLKEQTDTLLGDENSESSKDKGDSSSSTSSSSSSESTSSSESSEKSKKSSSAESTESSSEETDSSSSTSSEDSSSDAANTVTEDNIDVSNLLRGEALNTELADRAGKLDNLKKFADGTTNDQGVYKFDVPIDGKYHAYYVVNDGTEAHATASEPFVIITPVVGDDGIVQDSVSIMPKSDPIEDPVSEQKMVQTGSKNFWDSLVEFFTGWLK